MTPMTASGPPAKRVSPMLPIVQYQMIKDHRTKMQVGDVNRVLDGDLGAFIKGFLMAKAAGTLGQATPDDDE